ncbi:hypothetical protein [Acidocella aminolytica]|uniref:Uncharacterized protein n=1 Tax=Acidocella aminolytica 101 = DSM 11237 TaxID=1120923 RepID=A0A0D6PF41_9PROT|nr:hypothetical protein [Acidocella aminolytica]GAN79823.1 hypothetical protein Aam_030_056 [Acidocella aminolytica 101 = DSM 11237]GBQ31962.1 hypothetical protein AA11237_0023 [Acidocella aminolytica 101 = DSM 11237]SHF36209.1 hypothetical protein SAMN02746095_02977 [Acidocella aminolytica 101 = DSM 11237]
MLAAFLAALQVILQDLPEFAAIWPTLEKTISTGAEPTPADLAKIWAAAAAVHERVQSGGASADPAAIASAAVTDAASAASGTLAAPQEAQTPATPVG